MTDHVASSTSTGPPRRAHATPSAARPRRSRLRAIAEARGLVGRHAAAGRHLHLHTSDGERLHAWWAPGPDVDAPGVVLLHGFAARATKPAYAWLADELAASCGVLAPTLRGHGRSTGVTTLGREEVADVAAAVARLRAFGHTQVALVGASMGATTAANAIAAGVEVDAAVLVSGPAWMEEQPSTVPMRRLHTIWHSRVGRAGARLVAGVRLEHPDRWRPPVDPAEAVAGWDGPLLVLHDHEDPYFPGEHARRLADRPGGTTVHWDERGFGHAEDGFHGDLGRRLAAALQHVAAEGVFPERQAVVWPA